MFDYQESNTHSDEDAFAPREYENKRPRPMTSADYVGTDPRNSRKRFDTHDYETQENLPPLGDHNHHQHQQQHQRAFSGKPVSANPKSRKKREKAASSLRQTPSHAGTAQGFTLQKNKLVHNPSGDLAKMRPKKIPHEKERLYEENLHLKLGSNALRDENMKLRTRISNLEKENSKFERMIQEVNINQYKDPQLNKGTDNYLAMTLKQNIKELRLALNAREDELFQIKKSMKFTKIQEIEIQMKAFEDEAVRLRTAMDYVMKEKAHIVMTEDDKSRLQDDFYMQSAQLHGLKRDNEEMATAIKILEEQNFEYEKKVSEQEKKTKRDINQYKKALQEKEKEVNKLKNELNGNFGSGTLLTGSGNLKRPMTGMTKDDALRQELEKKTIENNNLINQLAEKRNQVLNLERQLRDLRSEFNDKTTNAQNEKQALLRELEKLKNAKAAIPNDPSKGHQQVNDLRVQELKLDDYVRRASLQRSFSQEEKDRILISNLANKHAAANEKKQKGQPKKRVQKVRQENVQNIGYELNLRLKMKKLTFEDIDKAIWPEKIRKTAIVTIKDMIEVLRNEPFNMASDEDIVLTARYIVEENEHEYLYYDENAKNDLYIVKSILKKLIGNLPPWNEAHVRKIHEEITEFCIQNAGGLRENLKVLCKTGFLTAKELRQACEIVEVPMTEEHIQYCIQKLFEHSDSIAKLSIDKLFEIFSHKTKLNFEDESKTFGSRSMLVSEASPMKKKEGYDPEYEADDMKMSSVKMHTHEQSIKEHQHEEDEDEESEQSNEESENASEEENQADL